MHWRTRAVAAAAALALLAGCISESTGSHRPASATSVARGGTPAPTPSAAGACPSGYAAPDPDRPRITLTFDVAADRGTVRGTEQVRFTPDLPIREVVFRLTANGPTATREGTSIRVDHAEAGGLSGAPESSKPSEPSEATFERAGASPGTQGGLLVLPLGRQVPAGDTVTARVEFTLTLGRAGFERFGRASSVSWWGSGQPLLAWERGVGWHRESLLGILGESATSEAARIDLTVTAPAADTVISSGSQDPPRPAGPGRRSWHATSATARDVSVAVGRLHTATAVHGGTSITAGALDQAAADGLRSDVESAVDRLRSRFGPFPFPALNVTLLPRRGGGIEYPGSILLLGRDTPTVVHEVAHQWFYAMVGDSQVRDPWLDEAFASYAEQLVDGEPTSPRTLDLPGRVGSSIAAFGQDDAGYFRVVYGKGAAALRAARDAAGPARFDAAVRCYLNANAWRIARPTDLARALAALPAAVAVLRHAGAL